MIRPATEKDLSAIVDMGEAFQDQTVHGQCAPFDPWSFQNLCRGLIRDDDGCLYVTKDLSGMAAAMWCPCMFNQDVRVATELWLYTEEPGTGRPLLAALEFWAEEVGASCLALTSQVNMKDVTRFYQRFGYEPVEKIFVKRLN